jgi:hypothetical protein
MRRVSRLEVARRIGVVKQIWTNRVGQAAVRYGEQAPVTTACCNACRTCVTTNVVALALAAVGGAGVAAGRFAKRLARPA